MDVDRFKRCTKCKEELPATPEFFWRRVYSVDGLWDICKACCSEMPCMVNRTAKRHAAKLQRQAALSSAVPAGGKPPVEGASHG